MKKLDLDTSKINKKKRIHQRVCLYFILKSTSTQILLLNALIIGQT